MAIKQYINKKEFFYSNSLFEKEKIKIFLKFVKKNPQFVSINLNILNFKLNLIDLKKKSIITDVKKKLKFRNIYKTKKKKSIYNFFFKKSFKNDFFFSDDYNIYLLKRHIDMKCFNKKQNKLISLKQDILKKKFNRFLYFSKALKVYFYCFKKTNNLKFTFFKKLFQLKKFSLNFIIMFKIQLKYMFRFYSFLRKSKRKIKTTHMGGRLSIRQKKTYTLHKKMSIRGKKPFNRQKKMSIHRKKPFNRQKKIYIRGKKPFKQRKKTSTRRKKVQVFPLKYLLPNKNFIKIYGRFFKR